MKKKVWLKAIKRFVSFTPSFIYSWSMSHILKHEFSYLDCLGSQVSDQKCSILLKYSTFDSFIYKISKKISCIVCTKVLIFCVEFWKLCHLTRDLSQAEKKITIVISWATDKTTNSEIQHRKWGLKKCKKLSILTLRYTFLVQKVFGCECKNQLNKKLGLLPQKSFFSKRRKNATKSALRA